MPDCPATSTKTARSQDGSDGQGRLGRQWQALDFCWPTRLQERQQLGTGAQTVLVGKTWPTGCLFGSLPIQQNTKAVNMRLMVDGQDHPHGIHTPKCIWHFTTIMFLSKMYHTSYHTNPINQRIWINNRSPRSTFCLGNCSRFSLPVYCLPSPLLPPPPATADHRPPASCFPSPRHTRRED